jgi:peptide/nickel transport system permease protein
LIQGAIVLLGLSVLVFVMTQLVPGDPILVFFGEASFTQEEYELVRAAWGLDKPIIVQYFDFLINALQGDLGTSFHFRQPVFDLISERFVFSFRIAIFAFIIAYLIGITTGTLAAMHRGSSLDAVLMTVEMAFISAPVFWLALLLQIIFGLQLDILPISGLRDWRGYILPCFTLGLPLSCSVSRYTRTSMLDVIRQDYLRTARSKGLSEFIVMMKHAFKNALIPIITIAAMQFTGLITGTMLVERVFTIPGLGSLSLGAFQTRDRPLLSGTVLYVGVVVVIMNMVADILYGVVDPRIRVKGMG